MAHVFVVSEIRKKRELLKISQAKMADVLHINWRTYQNYEKTEDMLLSQALKCTEYLKGIEELERKMGE
jgi:DNA-binding transcriptional regulator YiaG